MRPADLSEACVHAPQSVLAVVVLYRRSVTQAECWAPLQHLLDTGGGTTTLRLEHVLTYDNSPQPQRVTAGPHHSHVFDPLNGGTARAYAQAATLATQLAIPWLLLLDQDTALPDTFFLKASALLDSLDSPMPAALVPWVKHQGGAIVSPARIDRWGSVIPLHPDDPVANGAHLSAIASGSLMRVAPLNDLLPLPASLWLDYVDHWIFATYHRRGLRVAVFAQELSHDLSIESPGTLSAQRLVSVLRGEAIFHRLLGPMARLAWPFRIALRLVRLACANAGLVRDAIRILCSRPSGRS